MPHSPAESGRILGLIRKMRSLQKRWSFLLFTLTFATHELHGYDRVCNYTGNKAKAETVQLFTNNIYSTLANTCCDLFSHLADIKMIQSTKDAVKDESYCQELNDVMSEMSPESVLLLLLETIEQVQPCSYRVHTQSPVLMQITNATRPESRKRHYFEFWLNSRFGELHAGPLRFFPGCTDLIKIAYFDLVTSFRLALHLSKQSTEVMLNDLIPLLKLMDDDKLDKEWAQYRDAEAAKDKFNVSWVYGVCLLLVSLYAAFFVLLPAPDHQPFVQEYSAGSQDCLSDDNSTPDEKIDFDQITNKKGGYIPLRKFLANTSAK